MGSTKTEGYFYLHYHLINTNAVCILFDLDLLKGGVTNAMPIVRISNLR